jgi:hypothetical protein
MACYRRNHFRRIQQTATLINIDITCWETIRPEARRHACAPESSDHINRIDLWLERGDELGDMN